MQQLSNATRISIGLTLVTLSVLAGAYALGLVPRRGDLEGDRRLHLSQSMAVQFTAAIEKDDPGQMLRLAESVLGYTPDILSLAVRRADGSLLFASADHDSDWGLDEAGQADTQHIEIPLHDNLGQFWGSIEILFAPLPGVLLGEWVLFVFITAGCLLAFTLYMHRTLRSLDPSQVVPERVKAALDTLVEGVLVIDRNDRIVLANQALGAILEREPAGMLGIKASELDWLDAEDDRAPTSPPWADAAANKVCRGQSVRLRTPGGLRTLVVNTTPILGAGRHVRGTLVAFNDVTSIEEKNLAQAEMVQQLSEAQERVNRQNEELKRAGRDRVVRYDERPDGSAHSRVLPEAPVQNKYIPIHAVSALFAALRYRDPQTAEHSRRVADLCVRFAVGTMSPRDLFILEASAMLHDIGKIGVPDAILLKPDALTEDELKVMARHDRIGIEILECFDSNELVDVVRHHRVHFDSPACNAELPTGQQIPLRARLLSIADAYDTIVSDRVSRTAMSREAAFAELRRCSGTQFDPELVERFITMLTNEGDQVAIHSRIEFDLRLGLEIQRLSGALLHRDVSSIGALAERLQATATTLGRSEISEIAQRVGDAADIDFDLNALLTEVNELLDLCVAPSAVENRISDPGIPSTKSGEHSSNSTQQSPYPRDEK